MVPVQQRRLAINRSESLWQKALNRVVQRITTRRVTRFDSLLEARVIIED